MYNVYKKINPATPELVLPELVIPNEYHSCLKEFMKREFDTDSSLLEYINNKKGYQVAEITEKILDYLLEKNEGGILPPLWHSLLELHNFCNESTQTYIECKTY
jgi:phosphoserine phosphatase